MTNVYQALINRYLEHKARPDPKQQFITISSHHQTIPSTGTFIFPKPPQPDSNSKTQYFISGISIPNQDDNLALQQTELHIQIICGGQTWVAGQLGLLDTHALKNLIIPIPAANVQQEIKIIILNSTTENSHVRGSLNYDVVVAPDFHAEDCLGLQPNAEDLPCYRQIIYPLPVSGIIHDGRNTILGSIPNSIARIEVYVPTDLDVELPLDYQPKIYCDNLAIKPSTQTETTSARTSSLVWDGEPTSARTSSLVWDGEPTSARTHNQLSGPGQRKCLGYKTYSFDGTKIVPNSLIRLEPQHHGQTQILYSLIENQVVRMKSGYIGLAF